MHILLFFLAAFLFLKAPMPHVEPITVEVQYPKTESHPRVRGLGHPVVQTQPKVSLDDLGLRPDARPDEQAKSDPVPGEAGGWDLDNSDPKIARFNQYIYTVIQRQLDI